MIAKRSLLKGLASTAMALAIGSGAALAQSPEEFYAGQTIRVVSSTGAGGTMDLYLLLMMQHIGKHLPDGTNVVLEHRPGAGTIVMGNYMFNAAPQDGTVIGMPGPQYAINEFGRPDQAQWVSTEYNQIGRLVDLPRVFVTRTDSGVTSLEEAVGVELTHGVLSMGDTLDMMMSLTNQTLGTRFRAIPGYASGGATFVAMEQGEVQSTSAEPANLLVNKWHLVDSGEIQVIAQFGLESVPGLEEVPMIPDLIAEDHELRGAVMAAAGTAAYGLSIQAPPNVPEDRLAFLREAFRATMNDPALIAEAQERQIPINYADADYLQSVIETISEQPDHVRDWYLNLFQG